MKCIEITMTVPGAVDDHRCDGEEGSAGCRDRRRDGHGPATAREVMAGGARFVVGPV